MRQKYGVATLERREDCDVWHNQVLSRDEVELILRHNGWSDAEICKEFQQLERDDYWILVNSACQIC